MANRRQTMFGIPAAVGRMGRPAGGQNFGGAHRNPPVGGRFNPAGAPGTPKRGPQKVNRANEPITEKQKAELIALEEKIKTDRDGIEELKERYKRNDGEFAEKEMNARRYNRQHKDRLAAAKAELDEEFSNKNAEADKVHSEKVAERNCHWHKVTTDPELLKALDKANKQLNTREAAVQKLHDQIAEQSRITLAHEKVREANDSEARGVDDERAKVEAELRGEEAKEVGVDKALSLARSAYQQQEGIHGAIKKREGEVVGKVDQAGKDREKMEGKVNKMANLIRSVPVVTEDVPQMTICEAVGEPREIKMEGIKGQGSRGSQFEFTRVCRGPGWDNLKELAKHCVVKPMGCLIVTSSDRTVPPLALRAAADLLHQKHPTSSIRISAIESADGMLHRDLLKADAAYHQSALRTGGGSHDIHDEGGSRYALRDAVRFENVDYDSAVRLVEKNVMMRTGEHSPMESIVFLLSTEVSQLVVGITNPIADTETRGHFLHNIGKLYNDVKKAKFDLKQSFIGRSVLPFLSNTTVSAIAIGHVPADAALPNLRALHQVGEVDLLNR